MRLRGWVLAALMVPLVSAQATTSCDPFDADTFVCRWEVEVQPGTSFDLWDIPTFPRTLAAVDVTLVRSPDVGWDVAILERGEDGGYTLVSSDHHPRNATPALRHHAASTHVLFVEPRDELVLGISSEAGFPPGSRVEVAYVARRVNEGLVPAHPAATREDPHLLDEPGDASEPAWDIRAAWLDDARLDDGLFDAHLVVGNLSDIPPSAFEAPTAAPLAAADPGSTLTWKLGWTVAGRSTYVEWSVTRDDPATFWCELKEEQASVAPRDDAVLAIPLCTADVATGELHAVIPIGAIGAPPDGATFELLAARTRIPYGRSYDVVDDATQPRYLFALGGPEVWERYNPRLAIVPAPWYEDPFALENVADTVGVVGTLAALATFLVGLILIVRRRRRTSHLLARVDEIEDRGIDAQNTLLALGRLEQEFADMFRRHRISEAQYQVLSQRIASVATRHALRRELGLDDGVPGEGGARSVHIRRG